MLGSGELSTNDLAIRHGGQQWQPLAGIYQNIPASNPPPKVVRTEEQRFYFAGGELIRLLVGKKELKSGDERYAELKDGIVDTSGKLKAANGK